MQASPEILKELISKYNDSGKSVIPVFGKAPIIKDWSRFCISIPTEEDIDLFKVNGSTGIGLCLGEASGICCIDIDTENSELFEKITKVIQHSPSGKYGKKGCTYFYRLPPFNINQKVRTIKFPDGSLVEFFFGNKQTVIPPSIHPETNKPYQWLGEPLSYNYDLEFLPVFDISNIDAVEALAKGLPVSQNISKTLGRNNLLQREVAFLLKNRVGLLESISYLVQKDKDEHGSNAMFSDPSECRTTDPYLNALRFYTSQAYSINSRKKIGEQLEIPEDLKHVIAQGDLSKIAFEPIKDFKAVSLVAKWNDEWIPEVMRGWIQTFSRATSQPTDALFMSLLCSLSSLTGAKVVIEPTHNDKSWREFSNIYVMMIAASGGGKTLVERMATLPLVDIEKNYDSQYAKDEESKRRDKRFNEARIAALEKRYKDAVAADNREDADSIELEINEIKAKTENVKKRSFRSSNVTPERLIEIIEASKFGHFHSADELGVLLKQYDKKGYELLKAIHLNLHNNGRFSYETKSSGSYVIEPASLSILCSGQISVYNEYVRSLTAKDAQDDGHLQRFIPVVNIDPIVDFDDTIKNDFSVPADVQYIFNRAFALAEGITVQTTEDGNAEFVRIKKTSIRNWAGCQDKDENMLAGVESKKRGHIAKLSFLLSFIKNGGKVTTINAQDVKHAEEIVNNLYSRLEYCYKNKKDKMPAMRAEFATLVGSGMVVNGTMVRDLSRMSHKFSSDKEAMSEMIKEMEATNRIKILRTNKDSKKIYINPEYEKECEI